MSKRRRAVTPTPFIPVSGGVTHDSDEDIGLWWEGLGGPDHKPQLNLSYSTLKENISDLII